MGSENFGTRRLSAGRNTYRYISNGDRAVYAAWTNVQVNQSFPRAGGIEIYTMGKSQAEERRNKGMSAMQK